MQLKCTKGFGSVKFVCVVILRVLRLVAATSLREEITDGFGTEERVTSSRFKHRAIMGLMHDGVKEMITGQWPMITVKNGVVPPPPLHCVW